MAKQIGELKITGTIDDMTYYKMEGEYYARRKSSLDGKRVKRDPRFARTMQSAHRLARGSQLASKVYRSLPRVEQVYTLYKELKSLAIRGLKEGKDKATVTEALQQRVGKVAAPVKPSTENQKKTLRLPVTPFFTKPLFRLQGGRRKRLPGLGRRHHQPLPVPRE